MLCDTLQLLMPLQQCVMERQERERSLAASAGKTGELTAVMGVREAMVDRGANLYSIVWAE